MKDRLPLVADLLMDAAHADTHLHGDEKAAVRRLLRELLGASSALPMDLDFRIDEFAPDKFDLAKTVAAFANDPPESKRRLLELIGVVHAADGELDFAEDEHLRRVAKALGVPDADYEDLVVTVLEEIDATDDLNQIRYGQDESDGDDSQSA